MFRIYIALCLFLVFTLLSVGSDNDNRAFIFFVVVSLMMLIGFFVLTDTSHIKLSDDAISVCSLLFEYQLKWHEIEWLEIGLQGTFVFHGRNGKQLVVPPPERWLNSEKPGVSEFFDKQIDSIEMDISHSDTADETAHRNVKVKSASGVVMLMSKALCLKD